MLFFRRPKTSTCFCERHGVRFFLKSIPIVLCLAVLLLTGVQTCGAAPGDLVDDAIRRLAAGEISQGMSSLDAVIASSALPKARLALAYFVRGEMRRRAQQYDAAIKDFSNSLNLNNTFETHEARAYAYGAIGDFRNEIKDWDIVIQKDRKNVEILNLRARSHAFLKDFDQADVEFNRVLSIDPNNLFALSSLGTIAISQRRFRDSLIFIERAERIAPNDPDVIGRRAEYYAGIGEFHKAISLFDEAIRMQPDVPKLIFARLDVLRRTGAFDRAEADCKALSSMKSSYGYPTLVSKAASACGELKLDEGKYGEAIVDFDRSIATQLKPTAGPYSQRGLAYAFQNQVQAALADFNQAIAIEPSIPGAYIGRGMLRMSSGQMAAAQQDFWVAVKLPIDTDQGLALLWLTMSGAAGVSDHIAQISKSKSPIVRKLWPWPVVEMSAGLRSSAQVIAISNQDNPSAQGYEQNCSLPFFSAAIDKARTPPATFNRVAYGATMRRLVGVCPPGSIENLGARLEAAQFPLP